MGGGTNKGSDFITEFRVGSTYHDGNSRPDGTHTAQKLHALIESCQGLFSEGPFFDEAVL